MRRAVVLAFRLLCRLYPRRHREIFANDMAFTFARHLDAAHRRGRVAATLFAGRSMCGVLGEVIRLRLASSPLTGGAGRRAVARFADSMGRDLRDAWRSLRASPLATATVLVTLLLGTGAPTAIFSVINAAMLRDLPYPEAHRIVLIDEVAEDGTIWPVTTPNFRDWRERSRVLDELVVHTTAAWPGPRVVLGGSEPVRRPVNAVSEGFFRLFGVAPVLGRTPTAREYETAAPVAVVSDRYWRRQLEATADLDGVALTIDQTVYAVIGVLPPHFDYPRGTDVWSIWEPYSPGRANHNWTAVGRAAPAFSLADAHAELSSITRSLRAEHGTTMTAVDVRMRSLRDVMVGDLSRPLLLLFAASAIVLLVACANVASVQLSRGTARELEISVRAALGASRWRVARLIFVENVALGGCGAILGLCGGFMVARALASIGPRGVGEFDVVLDLRVVGLCVGLGFLTSTMFGLLPAWRSGETARSANLRVRAGDGRRPARRGWQTMIVVEVAATIVLLFAAGMLLQSLQRLMRVETGFDTDSVAALSLSLPTSLYPDDRAKATYYARLEERLARLPGVEAAGLVSRLPLIGGRVRSSFRVEGAEDYANASYRVASRGYFAALRIPLLRGRLFEPSDDESAPHVAVVNQTLADQLWSGREPLGRRIRNFGNDNAAYEGTWVTVVGVVADVVDDTLLGAPTPTVFVNVRQRPFRTEHAVLTIRSALPPDEAFPRIRQVARQLGPSVPVEVESLQEMQLQLTSTARFTVLVSAVYGFIALALAAAGIYGVVAYTVAQRTRELGIRTALGASRASLIATTLAESLRGAAIGIALGAAGCVLVGRVAPAIVPELRFGGGTELLGAALLLLATITVATLVPARRAIQLDPAETMRTS